MFRTLMMVFAGALLMVGAATQASAQGGCAKKKGGLFGGAAIGGVIGAAIGKKVLGGTGGALVGALMGGTLGGVLGSKLDKCEQERAQTATMSAASSEAGVTGEPVMWKSDTRPDVYGTATAKPAKMMKDGRQCRQIARVSYVAGEEVRDEPLLCRTPPETAWQNA